MMEIQPLPGSRKGSALPSKLVQLRADARIAACRAVSSAPRNRNLSLLVNGAGPRESFPGSRQVPGYLSTSQRIAYVRLRPSVGSQH
jgi:hypothetical protein